MRFPNIHPRYRVVAGYLSAALVLAVGGLALRGARETVIAYHSVRGMNAVLEAVHRVGDHVRDAETGQRGYLLTGRELYLEPFARAASGSDDAVIRLRGAVTSYPSYLPRVDSLSYFVQLKLAELGETVRLRRDEGLPAAEAVVRTDRGQQAMDEIRHLLTSLDASIAGDLKRAQASARWEEQIIAALIIAGAIVAAALALLTNVLHMRQAEEQERTYEELERQSEELQQQAIELESANAELELTTREMIAQTVEAEMSQVRLSGILGSATDTIIAFDDDHTVVFLNSAAERLLGVQASSAAGTQVNRFLPDRVHDQFRNRLMEVRRTFRTSVGGANLHETIALCDDGKEVPVQASMSYARAGAKGLFTMILRDVSEQRQLEEQFRQAQKMDAVGRLAGGIAHDFNNLLTVIGASTDFLLQDLYGNVDDLKRDLTEIRRATDRAAALTRQLLAFSRRQLVQPQLLDLNSIVEEMETMLYRLIGEDIILETAFHADLGFVRLDRGQVEQIIVNLVVNARDAMPNGGKVYVRTGVASEPPRHPSATASTPHGYVVLSVLDTGVGMDEATCAKIFEPFFTTKEQGKGIGLGLSTAYGIIKQYGGDIEVHSAPGRGTEIRLYFPDAGHVTNVQESSVPTIETLQGTETVLVVEDEEPLRHLARRILESRGYTVLDAANGAEALDVMENAGQHVDLVISDIVMPRMGGRDLVEQLLPRYPNLRVLFVSGYTEDTLLQHRVAELEITVLEKPFTPDVLASTVRAVLDRVPSRRLAYSE